jgi:hypothetical protein
MTQEEIVALLRAHDELLQQVEWFKRQLFGAKSERRLRDSNFPQLTLGEIYRDGASKGSEIEVAAHRRHRRDPIEAGSDDEDLRFDPSVPIKEIPVPNPEVEGENPDLYEVVGEKVTCRLAQRPGSYVVLRYVRKVYKRTEDGEFSCPPAPPVVLEKSCADVSFLAGLLVDKFAYHLSLYRHHQLLRAAGVHRRDRR